MQANFYYVYALKDPRYSPAKPFYIGKGTGSRAYDHLIAPDRTRKYSRIKEILDDDLEPLVDIVIDNLAEIEALRLEALLIAALGTEETGGHLTNAVVPTGLDKRKDTRIVVPQGVVEQAQLGLGMLKAAITKLIDANPKGITNSDTASLLGLRSDYRGRQKDYLSYSILGLLLRDGKIVRREGNPPRHIPSTYMSRGPNSDLPSENRFK